MPRCETKFHGNIEFSPEQVLRIPKGLFGFPNEQQWLLLEVPSLRPLAFLQSTATPKLCFLSLPVQVVEPGYVLTLPDRDVRQLGYEPKRPPLLGTDVLCLALLTIAEGRPTTANLQSPVVIDIARHSGRQVIVNAPYSPMQMFEPEFAKAC